MENNDQLEKIELRSPEINEILNRPSKGIVRWGSGILLIILVVLFIASYFFEYPDFVDSTIVISTLKPPVWLTARSTTTISEIYVKEFQQIKKGQLIAVLENPAETKDVFFIMNNMSDSTLYKLDNLVKLKFLFDAKLNLGELQTYWTDIAGRFTEYYLSVSVDNFIEKKHTMEKEFQVIEAKLKTLQRKRSNQKKFILIEQNRFDRDEKLHEKSVISSDDLQLSEENLLECKQILEEIEYSINCILSEKADLLQKIDNETLNHTKVLHCQNQSYQMALKEFATALDIWEQKYIIKSPLDGKLTFPEKRSPMQQVQTGDKLFAVVPENAGHLQAYLKYSPEGSGKVRKGQFVRIQIDGYPYMEFGTISGIIISVSLMPNSDKTFSAIASVPNPLITNYGKYLDFKGELTGLAKIRTEKLRLIERIINPIKYLLKSQGD
jgi:multidrug resistance efflux pump